MKGFLLSLIAVLLFIVLAPIGFFYQCIIRFYNISDYFYKLAIAIDQAGNVACEALFNHTLIKSTSKHRFGNEDETISSVIGKNKLDNTLSIIGKCLDYILDKLDKNHSTKSIEN